jgi:predicted dehydrogenase
MANAFRIRAAQGPFIIEIQRPDGSWITESFPFVDQYELELDHFAAVVLDGAPQLITPEDSLANALTLESIRKSWDAGPVQVPS